MLQSRNAAVEVTRWNPTSTDRWSAAVHETEHANLAHAPEWFGAIQKAYGHTPMYLQAEAVDGRLAVLPAFLLRSRIFGTVVASMPFLDGGGPCSPTADLNQVTVRTLIDEATKLGAGSVELRSTVELDLPVKPLTNKVNLVLAAARGCWTTVGQPRCEGPQSGPQGRALRPVRRVRPPRRPRRLLRRLRRQHAGPGIAGARRDASSRRSWTPSATRRGSCSFARGRPSSVASFALAFRDTLVVPWASSLRQHFALCPNVLLYWETLAAACREGFARFDFGRSSLDSGTYRFKRQWRAQGDPFVLLSRTRRPRRLARPVLNRLSWSPPGFALEPPSSPRGPIDRSARTQAPDPMRDPLDNLHQPRSQPRGAPTPVPDVPSPHAAAMAPTIQDGCPAALTFCVDTSSPWFDGHSTRTTAGRSWPPRSEDCSHVRTSPSP